MHFVVYVRAFSTIRALPRQVGEELLTLDMEMAFAAALVARWSLDQRSKVSHTDFLKCGQFMMLLY